MQQAQNDACCLQEYVSFIHTYALVGQYSHLGTQESFYVHICCKHECKAFDMLIAIQLS